MTCAACAARVQKKLGKLDGVTASVSFATERARVSAPASITPGALVSVIESAGYTAELAKPADLLRQRAKQLAEFRHLLSQHVEPCGRVPDLDTDHRAHQHDVLVRGHAKKLSERFG